MSAPDPDQWAEYGAHIEAAATVGGGRRRKLDTFMARDAARDVSRWTGAAEGTARDLEAFGHASPRRVPPHDLANLVRRGRNA